MPQFLIAIHRPVGYDGSREPASMAGAIDALNDDMVAAGVRVFVGGLQPPERAVAVTPAADDGADVRPGLYLVGPEQVGGFWVLEVADLDAAVGWGRRAAAACRAPVEVRPFF